MAHRGRRNADEALALALASGQTLRDAAAAAAISERTAARRWADPGFRRRVATRSLKRRSLLTDRCAKD
jgi:hypothetical protein